MTKTNNKIFTRQDLKDAAERTKTILSGEAGADLTKHTPHALQKAINEVCIAVVYSGASTGQEIIDQLLLHISQESEAIRRYAKNPKIISDDGSPYIDIIHLNNLSMAVTTFVNELGLKTLYLEEQAKHRAGLKVG